jgi:dienelactone hydrolase
MARQDLPFDAHGTPIAAYVYLPTGAGSVPCIVMAHGFTATRDQALPHYAERFVNEGYAVLLFDDRYFGASGGEPRQLLDIGKQHEDWRAAIAFARGLDRVDPARVVLWGSSFSGGHVVAIGVQDPNVTAVLAQVPFGDGLATLLSFPLKPTLQIAALAVLDQLGAFVGRKPVMVAAAGRKGELAILTADEALQASCRSTLRTACGATRSSPACCCGSRSTARLRWPGGCGRRCWSASPRKTRRCRRVRP